MIRSKLDPETKMELLIKLAFGIPYDILTVEYDMSKAKIINLRKNNYVKFNEFFDYWRIDKDVANLGLTPKNERALSVIKKFYKDKVQIISADEIYFNGKFCSFIDIIDLADKVLQKDNIYCFKTLPVYIKNYY